MESSGSHPPGKSKLTTVPLSAEERKKRERARRKAGSLAFPSIKCADDAAAAAAPELPPDVPPPKRKKYPYTGVDEHSTTGKPRARIMKGGVYIMDQTFETALDAAVAYDRASIRLGYKFGQNSGRKKGAARVNFATAGDLQRAISEDPLFQHLEEMKRREAAFIARGGIKNPDPLKAFRRKPNISALEQDDLRWCPLINAAHLTSTYSEGEKLEKGSSHNQGIGPDLIGSPNIWGRFEVTSSLGDQVKAAVEAHGERATPHSERTKVASLPKTTPPPPSPKQTLTPNLP